MYDIKKYLSNLCQFLKLRAFKNIFDIFEGINDNLNFQGVLWKLQIEGIKKFNLFLNIILKLIFIGLKGQHSILWLDGATIEIVDIV